MNDRRGRQAVRFSSRGTTRHVRARRGWILSNDPAVEQGHERLLVALVEHPRVADAAAAAGISKRQAYRYLADESFVEKWEALRAKRRDDIATAVELLDRAIVEASVAMVQLWTEMVCDDSGALAKDPRIDRIAPTVIRFLESSVAFEQPVNEVPRLSLVQEFTAMAFAQAQTGSPKR
jgi:hypothetical protein